MVQLSSSSLVKTTGDVCWKVLGPWTAWSSIEGGALDARTRSDDGMLPGLLFFDTPATNAAAADMWDLLFLRSVSTRLEEDLLCRGF